jgi:DNA adenine methylase
MIARSPLIWFGGKGKVAHEIINRMPEHKVYVEPFGGAAHVLSQKPPASNEVYNDIDGELVKFSAGSKGQTR